MAAEADRTFIFVPNRSGSMHAFRIVQDLARMAGRPLYSHNTVRRLRVSHKRMCRDPSVLEPPGIYGPIRFALAIPDIDHARLVVSLRDPRDVLVSMFFAYCYSHGGEIERGTGYRAEVAAKGIDDFVLTLATADEYPYQGDYGTHGDLWEFAGNIRDRHERLLALAERPNGILLTYEQMMTDFGGWVRSLAAAVGVTDQDAIADLEVEHFSAAPASEDIFAKHRQARPGDYRAKLKPETIAELDDVFASYFRRLSQLQGRRAASHRRITAEAEALGA